VRQDLAALGFIREGGAAWDEKGWPAVKAIVKGKFEKRRMGAAETP